MSQLPEGLENWPYNQLPAIAMRKLFFQLLQHVPPARRLFEEGEAGDAVKLLSEAAHVKLGKEVGIEKDYFLFLVLQALTSCSGVNTYQSE